MRRLSAKGILFKYLNLSGNEISHDLVKVLKKRRSLEGRRMLPKILHQNTLDSIEKNGDFTDIPKIDISRGACVLLGAYQCKRQFVWKETTDTMLECALSTTSLGRTGRN